MYIYIYIYISAYEKKKKSPKQPSEEIQVANPDIKVITGIKVIFLFEEQNDYGTNHMFQVLDETPLKEVVGSEEAVTNT